MSVTLKIAFISQINGQIIINEPEYIPVVGDIIDIHAEDFTDDQKTIKQLASYAETGIWKVGLKIIDYSKTKTTITIVLEEDGHP